MEGSLWTPGCSRCGRSSWSWGRTSACSSSIARGSRHRATWRPCDSMSGRPTCPSPRSHPMCSPSGNSLAQSNCTSFRRKMCKNYAKKCNMFTTRKANKRMRKVFCDKKIQNKFTLMRTDCPKFTLKENNKEKCWHYVGLFSNYIYIVTITGNTKKNQVHLVPSLSVMVLFKLLALIWIHNTDYPFVETLLWCAGRLRTTPPRTSPSSWRTPGWPAPSYPARMSQAGGQSQFICCCDIDQIA